MTTDQAPRARTVRQPRPRVQAPPGLWARCAEWLGVAGLVTWGLGWLPARPAVLAAITGAVSLAAWLTVRHRAPVLAVWVMAGIAVADAWIALAHWLSPWALPMITGLGATALVLLPVLVKSVAHDIAFQARMAELDASRDAARYLGRWGRWLAQIGITDVTALEETEQGAAHTVLLRLPQDGRVTISTLRHAREDLERAARMPRNSIRFEAVERDASLVRLHAVEKKFLGTAIPLPELPATMTVNEPLPLGVREDGRQHAELFREKATMILGVRGAGKTTLVHELIALFGRCVDTIVCVIDVDKGDRLAAPWIRPWVEGRAQRPGIDWLATTRAEAERMLRALDRVGRARQASLSGGSKLIPSAAEPQFVLIVDEMAGLLGMDYTSKHEGLSNQQMFKLAMDLTRLWRSEAIEPVYATQRATGSFTGGNDLKSQCLLRIGMGTATQQEGLSLCPDEGQAAALMSVLSTSPGAALYTGRDRGVPLPVMNYRLDPASRADAQRLDQIVIENAMIRPAPDEVSLKAMGDDWAKRWDEGRCPLYDRLMEAAHPSEAPAAEKPRVPMPADIHSEFAAMLGSTLADVAAPPGSKPPHPGRGRILALMAPEGARPTLGWSVLELVHTLKGEGITVTRETVHRWLSEWITQGTVERHNSRYRMRRDRT